MNEYVMVKTDCPQCQGEGRLETMVGLTYDGAQTWNIDECTECNGDKVVMVPARCTVCGEEVLTKEAVSQGVSYACVYCFESISEEG